MDADRAPSQDERLIRDFLHGEPEAVATLGEWISRAGWPFRQRLGEEWEDLAQDVHLELTRLLREDRFRGGSALKTYVWRVVNHACLDRVRSQKKWRWIELDEVGDRLEHEGLVLRSPGTTIGTRDLVGEVLRRTSEECRRMWALVLEGFSYAEMSGRLGVAEGTLRVKVLRCRQRALAIRKRLAAADGSTAAADVTIGRFRAPKEDDRGATGRSERSLDEDGVPPEEVPEG